MFEANGWTIAFRTSKKANRFLRLPLDLSWEQARDYSGVFGEHNPGVADIWFVPNKQAEDAGLVSAQDIGNILTVYRPGTHRHSRVRMVDVTDYPAGINR